MAGATRAVDLRITPDEWSKPACDAWAVHAREVGPWGSGCASRSRSRPGCGSTCRSAEWALRSAAKAGATRRTRQVDARSRPVLASSQASTTRRVFGQAAPGRVALRLPPSAAARGAEEARHVRAEGREGALQGDQGAGRQAIKPVGDEHPDFRLPSYSLAGLMLLTDEPTEASTCSARRSQPARTRPRTSSSPPTSSRDSSSRSPRA